MMKCFIVAILFAFAEAGWINTNCVTIRNINYKKEILKDDVKSPYQLAIDYDTNTLFFSYTAQLEEMFKIAYLSLKTGDYGIVTGIHGGFANGVNSRGHIVYMGGEDGIYQFNYNTKMASNLHVKDNANIWQMFYKNGLYFTTYPEEKAFLYKDEQVVEVPELKKFKTLLVAVNNNGDFVYSNSTGLFMYNKKKGSTLHLSDAVGNGFSADIDGNIYYSAPNGIYYIDDNTQTVEKIAPLDNIYGVAIEGNGNIIYATENSIVRLKPTKNECFSDKVTVTNVA